MNEPTLGALAEILYLAERRYGSGDPLVKNARAQIATLTAERDEAVWKRESMASHLTTVMEELKRAQANVRTATASRSDVWFWQGDGHDEPASLACPVVMEPETLRAILAERDRAASLVVSVCPDCGPRKTTDEDGACKTCGADTFFRLLAHPQDPRIESWRAYPKDARRDVHLYLSAWSHGLGNGAELADAALQVLGGDEP